MRTPLGAVLVLGSLWCLLGQPVTAQGPAPAAPSTVQPATPWLARVVVDELNVRSRPDLNSTPVARLSRGSVMKAVGRDGEWLIIDPPTGTFALVSSDYVRRTENQQGVVQVSSGSLRVRVGSTVQTVDPNQSEVIARLENGATVQILGEQNDGWMRIVPPAGVQFFVSEAFTEPAPPGTQVTTTLVVPADASGVISAVVEPSGALPAPFSDPAITQAAETPVAATPTLADYSEVQRGEPGDGAPAMTDPPADGVNPVADATPPVQPTPESAPSLSPRDAYWRLVEQLRRENAKPLMEQQLEPLREQMLPLAEQTRDAELAEYARLWVQRIDARLGAIHSRQAAQEWRAAPLVTADFSAVGKLETAFSIPAGSHGLRYYLRQRGVKDPLILEFDSSSGIKPFGAIGQYVGIAGAAYQDETLGKSVILVTRLTVVEKPDDPLNTQNPRP